MKKTALLCLLIALPAHAREPSKLPLKLDPAYTPARGDHAELCGYHGEKDYFYEASGCTYEFAYHEYWKAVDIKDYDGTRELEERGLLIRAPLHTKVLVLDIERYPTEDVRADAAVVRVMDGPHKGKKLWVARFNVVRLIPNPDYKEEVTPPAPAAKAEPSKEDPKDREERAEKLYRLALSLVVAGKDDGALTLMKEVARKFPDTAAGRAAKSYVEKESK